MYKYVHTHIIGNT